MRLYDSLTKSKVWVAIAVGEEMEKTIFDLTLLQRFYCQLIIACLVVRLVSLGIFTYASIPSLIVSNGISVILYALLLLFAKKNHLIITFLLICVDMVAHALVTSELLGLDSGFNFYLLPCAVLIFLFSQYRLMHRLVLFELLLASFLFIEFHFRYTQPALSLSTLISDSIHYGNLLLIFASLGWLSFHYRSVIVVSGQSSYSGPDPEITDHLTGLFKREAVLNRIDEILMSVRHNKQSMSIVILDIDNASDVVHKYGSSVLDSVLIYATQVLQSAIRYNDRASRWGGNQFMLLLPGGSTGSAVRISERINHQLSSSPLILEGHSIHLKLSFGIAEMANGEDFNECLLRAENALIEAKKHSDGHIQVAERMSSLQHSNGQI